MEAASSFFPNKRKNKTNRTELLLLYSPLRSLQAVWPKAKKVIIYIPQIL